MYKRIRKSSTYSSNSRTRHRVKRHNSRKNQQIREPLTKLNLNISRKLLSSQNKHFAVRARERVFKHSNIKVSNRSLHGKHAKRLAPNRVVVDNATYNITNEECNNIATKNITSSNISNNSLTFPTLEKSYVTKAKQFSQVACHDLTEKSKLIPHLYNVSNQKCNYSDGKTCKITVKLSAESNPVLFINENKESSNEENCSKIEYEENLQVVKPICSIQQEESCTLHTIKSKDIPTVTSLLAKVSEDPLSSTPGTLHQDKVHVDVTSSDISATNLQLSSQTVNSDSDISATNLQPSSQTVNSGEKQFSDFSISFLLKKNSLPLSTNVVCHFEGKKVSQSTCDNNCDTTLTSTTSDGSHGNTLPSSTSHGYHGNTMRSSMIDYNNSNTSRSSVYSDYHDNTLIQHTFGSNDGSALSIFTGDGNHGNTGIASTSDSNDGNALSPSTSDEYCSNALSPFTTASNHDNSLTGSTSDSNDSNSSPPSTCVGSHGNTLNIPAYESHNSNRLTNESIGSTKTIQETLSQSSDKDVLEDSVVPVLPAFRVKRSRLSTESEDDIRPEQVQTDYSVDLPAVSKAARFKYTQDQASFLKAEFAKNMYPSYDDLVSISHEINVPVRQLQIWFQNKRASTTGTRKPKHKRWCSDQICHDASSVPQSLPDVQPHSHPMYLVVPNTYTHRVMPHQTSNSVLRNLHLASQSLQGYIPPHINFSVNNQNVSRMQASTNNLQGCLQNQQNMIYQAQVSPQNNSQLTYSAANWNQYLASLYAYRQMQEYQVLNLAPLMTPDVATITASRMANHVPSHYNQFNNLQKLPTARLINTATNSHCTEVLTTTKSSNLREVSSSHSKTTNK